MSRPFPPTSALQGAWSASQLDSFPIPLPCIPPNWRSECTMGLWFIKRSCSFTHSTDVHFHPCHLAPLLGRRPPAQPAWKCTSVLCVKEQERFINHKPIVL